MMPKLHAVLHRLAQQHGLQPSMALGPDAAALPVELQPGEYADDLAPTRRPAAPAGP